MGFGEGCRKDPGKVLGIGAGPGEGGRKKCKNTLQLLGIPPKLFLDI